MATRTNEAAVREIIASTLGASQINQFIADANLWVTEELVPFTPTISAGRLEIIERYLACALVRLKHLGLKSSTIGDVTESYQVDSDVTDYLTRAAGFDPSGKVRSNFLAPKLVATPTPVTRPLVFGVGQGFADERKEGGE